MVIVGVALAIVVAIVSLMFSGCTLGLGEGPTHQFLIQPPPRLLTGELAIAKARETLVLDGYSINEWDLRAPVVSTKASDGTPDKCRTALLHLPGTALRSSAACYPNGWIPSVMTHHKNPDCIVDDAKEKMVGKALQVHSPDIPLSY